MEYTFTLKYQLDKQDCDPNELVERLGAAGCDDALIGTGQVGRLALEFTRVADSAKDAVYSALSDVKCAIPSARLIEAGPDLVGLTDVAQLIGVSRQNMRKLTLNHQNTFPAPVHEGSSTSIWHLADVLSWLSDRGTYNMSKTLLDTAQATLEVNVVKEAQQLTYPTSKDLKALFHDGL